MEAKINLSGHRLPIIEECIRALANCREAGVATTIISPHMMQMTREQVSVYTKRDLGRRMAALLVDDAEITESIVWSNQAGRPPQDTDTEFVARTVVMKASTYHALCQALRHLQREARDAQFPCADPSN